MPSLVQHAIRFTGTSTDHIQGVFSSSNTAGNLLLTVLVIPANRPPILFTDSQGNSYSGAPAVFHITPNQTMYTYYTPNCIGGTAVNTITASLASSVATLDMWVGEISGLSQVSPFDLSTSTTGSSGTVNSPATGNVGTPRDFLIATVACTTATGIGAGAGWTLADTIPAVGSGRLAVAYTTAIAITTYTSTYSLAGAENFLTQVVAFKPDPGAVGPGASVNNCLWLGI